MQPWLYVSGAAAAPGSFTAAAAVKPVAGGTR
jgi:hypothetical protein